MPKRPTKERQIATALLVFSLATACGGTTESPPSTAGAGGSGGQPAPSTSSSSSTSGGGGEGGSMSNPNGNPLCQNQPFENLPNEQWTYLPVDNAVCGNGSPVGIGINKTDKSKKLLIMMMGGGGCFSAKTCVPKEQGGLAKNIDGYNKSKFADDIAFFGAGSVLRRTEQNPFRDYNFVFVPYCTGDFHTGSTVAEYGIHHQGFANMKLFLDRIVPTFCDADRIVLSGVSAGGFGSAFNYEQVAKAFDPARVNLVDDSGPFLEEAYMDLATQAKLEGAWGTQANFPADCAECKQHWHALYPYLANTYPTRHFSLLSALHDYSISGFFGLTGPQMDMGLTSLADNVLAPLPNFKVFYLMSSDHVWLDNNLAATATLGTSLGTFLSQEVGDDPAWTNVRP